MANAAQLKILKKGVKIWNQWREKRLGVEVDLRDADLQGLDFTNANLWDANMMGANLMDSDLKDAHLGGADLRNANLTRSNLEGASLIPHTNLSYSKLTNANLVRAQLGGALLEGAHLQSANLAGAILYAAHLQRANFSGANLTGTSLNQANLTDANLFGSLLQGAKISGTILGKIDLSESIGLEHVIHEGPSHISSDTFALSRGRIPEAFLRGCGLSDWEIEAVKLYNPDLSNEERNKILYKIYDLQATQAIQISPLFVSYSHADGLFVDKVGKSLQGKGVRYWRDTHDMKAGRIEKQIDQAIRQNPTVLLVLSEESLSSDWVEHEVRLARTLEKELGRDILCPVALDNSWKSSRWPKRIMEQIMEYNILDFSEWQDNSKFWDTFNKLIDGLELFYKKG